MKKIDSIASFVLGGILLLQPSKALCNLKVALTFDDLPTSGSRPSGISGGDVLKQILKALKKHKIKRVYGFVNAGRLELKTTAGEGEAILTEWVENGHLLGNHTFTHPSANAVNVEKFFDEIIQNEPVLQKLMGDKDFHWFRYPHLEQGDTPEKQEAIRNFLKQKNYKIAEVTIDHGDWDFAEPFTRCMNKKSNPDILELEKQYLEGANAMLKHASIIAKEGLGRDANQILILHINAFTARMLDRLLSLYEKEGVIFISLSEASNDAIYRSDVNGFTFMGTMVKEKGKLHRLDWKRPDFSDLCTGDGQQN